MRAKNGLLWPQKGLSGHFFWNSNELFNGQLFNGQWTTNVLDQGLEQQNILDIKYLAKSMKIHLCIQRIAKIPISFWLKRPKLGRSNPNIYLH